MPKLRTPWTGRIKTIASMATEKAGEIGRWGKQQQEAEKAREIESERGTLWTILGTGACLLTGLGPACIPIGTAIGKVAKGVGTWKGKAIEDFKMDTSDVGRWHGAEDKVALEQTNKLLEKYDTGEFWSSVKDFGMSLLNAYKLGGGIGEKGLTPGDWSAVKWGGEAAGQTTAEAMGSLLASDAVPLVEGYQADLGQVGGLGEGIDVTATEGLVMEEMEPMFEGLMDEILPIADENIPFIEVQDEFEWFKW